MHRRTAAARVPAPAQLAALFEPRPAPRAADRELDAELAAVQRGRKAMALVPLAAPGATPEATAELAEVVGAAVARGLAAVIRPDPLAAAGGIAVYALPLEAVWRVPAMEALWSAGLEAGPWSDAAERQQSLLLGYGRAARRAWIARGRQRSAAWGAPTAYALLDRAHCARVDALGRRALGPAAALVGLTLFAHARGHALRRDAHRRVPRELAIARAAVAPALFARLFRRSATAGSPVWAAELDARAAREVVAGLRSGVELYGARGWR
jgi:hypothetical protein